MISMLWIDLGQEWVILPEKNEKRGLWNQTSEVGRKPLGGYKGSFNEGNSRGFYKGVPTSVRARGPGKGGVLKASGSPLIK